MLMGPSPQINCFCSSGSDLLKHTTKGFSVNRCLNQQPVLDNRHRRGILAGCTLSIILFLAGMNIILEYSMQASSVKWGHLAQMGVGLFQILNHIKTIKNH